MLDPRLKILQAVDYYGTVTAAAAALSYTPSAISYQLRQLSELLGVELIEPSGRGIKLTPAARTVLRHAAIMRAQWELAQSELAETVDEPSGPYTLCGFSTASTQLLPYAGKTLRDRHPRLRVRLVQADPAECFRLLQMEEADLALVMVTADSPPLDDLRFDQQLLVDDPLDLVVPANHPLTSRRRVTLADAADEPWVVGTPGGAYHQLTVTACVAAGFTPNIAHQADEWETGAAIVSQDMGVMLVPRLWLLSSEWAVTRIRLSGEPVPARKIVAATRKGAARHPLVAETLELVKARCETLYSTPP
ncbi:LysR family transcriptional regulator [Rhodococcus koreensis]|uniref:DNA-binding transcriptional regulator, LysR family n=2 Tax=Rhodococcus koreensis TaxID=99653 RepID=A0A1H4RHS2_9NOCA|nr:LysR family transcriptional regulator [Rhodococcus koreensis]QSE82928.1 LysR family transcriptional regulator [Rhodococcus koreensis]SEC31443.1 DNA-binding transcriptional regulator, LysR family [Rhodococcus koreensis]